MATTLAAPGGRASVHWGSALMAGLVAMIVFTIIEIAFSWAVRGAAPMQPLIVFGTVALHALMPSTSLGGDLPTAIAGATVLLALGALSGVILACIVERIGIAAAAVAGAVFGLAMYAIDMEALARLFPVLTKLRDWMSALAYVLQGALAAGLYKVMAHDEATIDDAPDLRQMRRIRPV